MVKYPLIFKLRDNSKVIVKPSQDNKKFNFEILSPNGEPVETFIWTPSGNETEADKRRVNSEDPLSPLQNEALHIFWRLQDQ